MKNALSAQAGRHRMRKAKVKVGASAGATESGAALTAEQARELIEEHARLLETERRERERLGLVGKAQAKLEDDAW